MKNIRRLAVLLLALLLLAAPARAATATFSDVPETHWAYASIQRATELGLVSGIGDGKFGLGQSVTRAQYATMLCRLMGWTMLNPAQGSFDDNQDRSAWYFSAIETAAANGAILKLLRTCKPNEPLAREEMAVMTLRALGYGDGALAGLVQDDCPFTDVTTNRGYLALSNRMGFMSGVGGNKFSPRTVSTREQAAAVLLRVYDRLHASVAQGPLPPGTSMAVYVESITGTQTPVPMCPRAPLEKVYAAAVRAGAGGTVVLRTAPWAVTVADGRVSGGAYITQEALAAYLADSATRTSRSARYGSSYLINGDTVVWYESAEDVAEKVMLCRLLGVTAVYTDAVGF